METRNLYFPVGLIILVLGAAWIGASRKAPGQAFSGGIPAPRAGFIAPGFSLEDQYGSPMALEDFRGQAVLVNIWASWCPPCRAEMPAMQRVYESLKDEGFTILAVNATAQDSRADALEFISQYGLTFPILFDTEGVVARMYENRALPSSYFIDPQGRISEVVIGGPMAETLLVTRVEQLLNANE